MAAKAKSEKSCGIICQIKKAIKSGATGRKTRMDKAISAAEKGQASKDATLANPSGSE